MQIKDEVRALLGANRKGIAPKLGVSESLLSQWSTGEALITEPHLAKLVEVETEGSESAKASELLRLLLLLWQERVEREEKKGWTAESKGLARRALDLALTSSATDSRAVKSSGRTLVDFPDSFYPLAIISGDKREDSESRITQGDFGAVSASHAELRWLCELGLRKDVEVYGDKVFVLEDAKQLKERFGGKHLLIVGSPGSNHLARRCLLAPHRDGWRSAAPIFRFNLPQYTFQKIEDLLESLKGLRPPQLAGKRADESTARGMKEWLHSLFGGGILDPTNTDYWVRGSHPAYDRDYGLVSLARNPFSDGHYTCIMVAGFHLLGTAHALKMLANAQETFRKHPFGGVIKVLIDMGLPFAKRFDVSTPMWDDEDGYTVDTLQHNLKQMQSDLPPTLHITKEEISECLLFLKEL